MALADDGDKVLKRMTGGSIDNQLTVLPEDIGEHISEAEHAFTKMMPFYVPSQAASGALVDPLEYLDIDENPVEELSVAKPLVNVFVYGPAIGVEHTPFAHSFMDVFAAVSLDDGVTWKTRTFRNPPAIAPSPSGSRAATAAAAMTATNPAR